MNQMKNVQEMLDWAYNKGHSAGFEAAKSANEKHFNKLSDEARSWEHNAKTYAKELETLRPELERVKTKVNDLLGRLDVEAQTASVAAQEAREKTERIVVLEEVARLAEARLKEANDEFAKAAYETECELRSGRRWVRQLESLIEANNLPFPVREAVAP
jgi:chromosome segregation ATPase